VAKKKKDLEAYQPPPPDIQTELPDNSADAVTDAGVKRNLAFEMARFHKMPMMNKAEFEKLALALKPLGVKFELTPSRSGLYRAAKEPFAYKAKMLTTTFIVDLS
jgi:hypothetical protein